MSSTSSTLSTSFVEAVVSNGVVAGGVDPVELGVGFVKIILAFCVVVLVASVVVSIACVTDRGGRVLTGSVCFLDDVVVDGVVFVVVILGVVVV